MTNKKAPLHKTLVNKAKVNNKIQINPNIAKQNLQNLKTELSNNPQRLKSLKGLNTDICNALGIDGSSASHYGGFNINDIECSIRVSNHNSNAHTYNINLNNNISLKIKPSIDNNRFKPSENVTLEEFTYFDSMISQDKNLVFDIIDSLIDYLSTGEYLDKSGLAKKNYSPNQQVISQQRVQQTLQRKDNEDFINRWHMGENKQLISRNKSKKIIRLTEDEFCNMIYNATIEILTETKDNDTCGVTDSNNYLAKPKKGAKLNDYELARIFTSILQDLVKAKRLSYEDAELLTHYGMYNNDCFTHL